MNMNRNFKEALRHRRSCYAIDGGSPIPDQEIQSIVDFVLLHTPSAFNSQSTRIVLLLNEHHKKLWNIVMETLRGIVPAAKFEPTERKINGFAAGHGTALFLEDQDVVKDLQVRFPTYAANAPTFAQHTSAMHQLALWILLEDAGFGASLQHYNPIIDAKVRETWRLDESWALVAQMPFGGLVEPAGAKESEPLEKRRIFFA
jgi:predicted oxidoreductase (fatty acid repression mutant protein)